MTPQLLAPSGLAPNEPYWLVGDPEDPRLIRLQAILAHASPKARYMGAGNAMPPTNGTIVLFDADAFTWAYALEAAGVAPERIRYLPLFVNYQWAYWDAWGWFEGRPELYADLTNWTAFEHAVKTCKYMTDAAGDARTWDDLTNKHSYWGAYRAELAPYKTQIEMVRNGLADDKSRRLYDLAYQSDPQTLWTHFMTTVFNDFDYLKHGRPAPGDTILNLGIFSGHEIPAFMTVIGKEGHIYNVDPLGHDFLSDYVKAVVDLRPEQVHEVRMAAGSQHGTGYFTRYFDGQACIVAPNTPGAEPFDIRPLDDFVEASGIGPIDFIKIDIEGMELEALVGLKRTLQRDRPTLSLAIYHYPAHFWSLPLMLMNVLTDYEFHIDHFSPLRFETLLTCVPRERVRGANLEQQLQPTLN